VSSTGIALHESSHPNSNILAQAALSDHQSAFDRRHRLVVRCWQGLLVACVDLGADFQRNPAIGFDFLIEKFPFVRCDVQDVVKDADSTGRRLLRLGNGRPNS
jgi:hypothetical protein